MEFDEQDLTQNTTENHLGVPGLASKYNYAGPGTYFHARQKGSDYYKALMKRLGKPLVGTEPYDKPYNKLDRAAMAHDAVYANKNATTEEIRRSDEAIVRAAMDINVSDGLDQFTLAQFTIIGFNVKGSGEDIGFLPRGWLANGQESHMAHVQHLAENVLGVFTGMTELSLLKGLEKLLAEYSIHLTGQAVNGTFTNPKTMAPFWGIFGLLVYKGKIKFPSSNLVGILNTKFNNMIQRIPALRQIFPGDIDLGALIETHCPPKLARVIRQVRGTTQTESLGVEMTDVFPAPGYLDPYGMNGSMSLKQLYLEQDFQHFMGPEMYPGPPVDITESKSGKVPIVGTESKSGEAPKIKTVGTVDEGEGEFRWNGSESLPPAREALFSDPGNIQANIQAEQTNPLIENGEARSAAPEGGEQSEVRSAAGEDVMGGAAMFAQPIVQAWLDNQFDGFVSKETMSNAIARDITKGTIGSAAFTPAAAAMAGMSVAEVFPPILAGTVTAEVLNEAHLTSTYQGWGADRDTADVLSSATKGGLTGAAYGGVAVGMGAVAAPVAIAGIAVSATLGAAVTALEKWHSGDPDPRLQDENGPTDAETNAFQKNMEVIKDPNSGETELLEANEQMWSYMRKYRPSDIPRDIGFEEIQDDDKNTQSKGNRRRLREEARWRPYSKQQRKDKEQWKQLYSKSADRSITTDELTDFWVLTHNYMSDIGDLPLTAEQKTHINKLTQEKATLKDDISAQDEAMDSLVESYSKISHDDSRFIAGFKKLQVVGDKEEQDKARIKEIDEAMRNDFRIAAKAQTTKNKQILDAQNKVKALLEQLNAKMTARRDGIIGNLVKYGKITHLIYLDRPKREKPTIEGLVYI